MPTITYKALRDSMRRDIWPAVPGEPANLRDVHNKFFLEAFLKVQQWVKCLQVDNSSVFEFCSTNVEFAKTVVNAPIGNIRRVYTVANGNFDDKIFYRSTRFNRLEEWARELRFQYSPDQLPILQGFRPADKSTDVIDGRARTGRWAIYARRLYIAPWLQSNETLVIEWDGVRSLWSDDDVLDQEEWDLDVQEVIKLDVKIKHEGDFGCDRQRKKDWKVEYDEKLADLIYRCQLRTEQQDEEPAQFVGSGPTGDELDAQEIPTELAEEIFFANIGDYGDPNSDAIQSLVSALVKSKAPEFIVTNGDNIYSTDYDDQVGQFYASFLYPYSGLFGPGAETQKMFPIPGNHDWDVDETLAAYKIFFGLTRRYYELVKGPVHFFLLSSDPREPDGSTSTSTQAMWLKARMALSTAHWKIVVIHDPPYVSAANDYPGNTRSRWPFKAWGADLVISGDNHFYERQEVDGLPYIINGAGGRAPLRGITSTPDATSLVRYNTDWGAGFCRVTCEKLTYQFFNTSGVLIDTLEISK